MDLRKLILIIVLACVAPAGAYADVYVRVLTQSADVKTGPGGEFRTMHVAGRGDVYAVKERGTKGYWFLVALEDGTRGWIYGEQVATYDVVENDDPGFFTRIGRAISGAILGPSPVPFATIQLSFSAGLLGGEGVYLFRAKDGQLRTTLGIGLWKLSFGLTAVLHFGDGVAAYLGPELDLRLLPGKGPRSPVIDLFLRADFAVSDRDTRGDLLTGGLRVMLDLI